MKFSYLAHPGISRRRMPKHFGLAHHGVLHRLANLKVGLNIAYRPTVIHGMQRVQFILYHMRTRRRVYLRRLFTEAFRAYTYDV